MKTIPLTQGKVAIVSDADYAYLKQWTWCYCKDSKGPGGYAVRGIWRNGRTHLVKMHRVVAGRSGKLSAIMLGAYQVSEAADLANWATPGQQGGGIGGAMDLAASGAPVIVVMEHTDSKGRPKLVPRCAYPLTAPSCVTTIVTDLALFQGRDGRFVVEEIANGFTQDDIRALTPMRFDFAEVIGVLGET